MAGVDFHDEDLIEVALKERAQFGVADIYPVIEAVVYPVSDYLEKLFVNVKVLDNLNIKNGGLTKTLGVISMDAIVQFRFEKSKNAFHFLTALEKETWFYLFGFALLISIVLAAKQIRHFWKYLEYVVFTVFMGSPDINLANTIPFLVIIWTTAIWILQQLYGGDMVSAMMEVIEKQVLDSFDDLHKTNKTIYIVSSQLFGNRSESRMLNDYFQGYVDYREEFKKRARIVEYLHTLQTDSSMIKFIKQKITSRGGRKRNVCLFERGFAHYVQHQFDNRVCHSGNEVNVCGKLYVSESGGDVQPLFFLYTPFSNPIERTAVNKV